MTYTGGQVVLRRTRGEVTAEIRRGKKGQLIVTTENPFLIPLAIIEILVMALLLALTYCLRFDPTIRFNSDMVDFSKVLITCDSNRLNYELSRPYYDYANSNEINLQGLELQYDLPEWVFFICCFIIPITIFCMVEGLRAWFPGKKRKEVVSYGYLIPQFARRILRISFVYVIGICLIGIFISIFKYNISSPRPHFMSVCFNSTGTLPIRCEENNFYWNPQESCDPDVNQMKIVEALKSFPSYHAAVAMYCGTYTSAYVMLAARVRSFYTGSFLVLLGLTVMTMLGATHRLGTGHSFPIDIIIGSLLGFLFALFVIKITLNKFREHKWKVKIVDPIPHNEDKMLPVNELNHHQTLPAKPLQDLISVKSSEYSGFSSDLDSDEDYESITARISQSKNMIPRAAVTNKQPQQAINKNLNSAYGLQTPSISTIESRSTVNQDIKPTWNSSYNIYSSISRERQQQRPVKNSFKSENRKSYGITPLKPPQPFSYTNSGFEKASQL